MKQLITRQHPLEWAHEAGSSSIKQQRVNRGCDAVIRFGRFRVLLRHRRLIADGVPIELGTRAFDLLLVLLEADGALVTKDELLGRVWPGIVVSEANLKAQVFALRKALGADRDVIHTEFGRGYRFIATVRSPSGALVNARCGGSDGQVKGYPLNGSLGDRRSIDTSKTTVADTLVRPTAG